MPVELRKRKAHQAPSAPAPALKKAGKAAKPAATKTAKAAKKATPVPAAPVEDDDESAKEEAAPAPAPAAPPAKTANKKKAGKVAVDDVVDLEDFGGEIETNDGKKTSLKDLVEESKAGVVLFTYPKASTPGCAYLSTLSNHLSSRL